MIPLLVFLLPTYLVRFTPFGIPTTLWEILLWLTFFWFVGRRKLQIDFWRHEPLRFPLLLIAIAGTIAVVVAPDLRAALGQWKALIVDPLIFYWLVRAQSPRQYGQSILALIASGALVGLHALWQWAHGVVTIDQRVLGIYAQDANASPNYLGLYLAPIAAMAIASLWQNFEKSKNIYLLIFVGVSYLLMAGGILASGSRSALLGMFLGGFTAIIIWHIHQYPRKYWRILVGSLSVVGLVGIFLIPRFLPDLSAPESAGGRLVSSDNIRLEIWRTTVDTIIPQMSVWGLGWANYQTVFGELTRDRINYPEFITPLALHPHNFFLTSWVTLGYLGLVGWVGVLALLIRRVRGQAWSLIIPLAGLTAVLTQGLVDSVYYKNDLAAMFMVIAAGLLLSPARGRQPHKTSR